MNILVACEFSGRVRDAFTKKGHFAVSYDLLPSESKGDHVQGDVLFDINIGWDMMLAFPPCTHLASSGARWFKEKREDGRQQQGIDFFMALVNARIDKIMIENPIGIMSTIYRKPDQIIQPYEYGEPYRKKTCLWLKNLPKLKPTNIVEPHVKHYKDGTVFSADYGWSTNRHNREKTYKGIAEAMAEQWG